jgi:hypothetical protein
MSNRVNDLEQSILEAIGIDPKKVRSFTLTAEFGTPTTIVVEQYILDEPEPLLVTRNYRVEPIEVADE